MGIFAADAIYESYPIRLTDLRLLLNRDSPKPVLQFHYNGWTIGLFRLSLFRDHDFYCKACNTTLPAVSPLRTLGTGLGSTCFCSASLQRLQLLRVCRDWVELKNLPHVQTKLKCCIRKTCMTLASSCHSLLEWIPYTQHGVIFSRFRI